MKFKQTNMSNQYLYFSLFFLISSLNNNVSLAGEEKTPFSPKAYLIRYWNQHITTKFSSPPPEFFLSKASPLSAVDSAVFAVLAAKKSLSSRLPDFCSAAHLLCASSAAAASSAGDFVTYVDKNFTGYGKSRHGGEPNSFKNYTSADGSLVNAFSQYSRKSTDHADKFSSYAGDGNLFGQMFDSYGTAATRGDGDFKLYGNGTNVPAIIFGSYSEQSNGRKQRFGNYGDDANFAGNIFSGYGKSSDGATEEFRNYAARANLVREEFNSYGEAKHRGRDSFNSYIKGINLGEGHFKSYGDSGESSAVDFKNYRVDANQGHDEFQSYGKGSVNETVDFSNYGISYSFGESNFTSYGKNSAAGETVNFKVYGDLFAFKEYAKGKKGISFAEYKVTRSSSVKQPGDGNLVNSMVERGKFFRESMLKEGVLMPMPDIKDKMPERSFLPRTIAAKLPLSSSEITELKVIFNAADNSPTEAMMVETLSECERAPSRGETKRCVSSAEDMIDFAISELGQRDAAVRTTENVSGSKRDVMIGAVRGIDGGRVTKVVSCHQSLFPYLVYYCHSVPKVRVYEADILDPVSTVRINGGVAICHVDTSAWSPTHGAFLALGFGPGRIEVCHWIFENDMTWTIAD